MEPPTKSGSKRKAASRFRQSRLDQHRNDDTVKYDQPQEIESEDQLDQAVENLIQATSDAVNEHTPDVENVSNDSIVEALWALGALEPKKRLKRPDGGVGVWWKVCRKQPPKGAVFCHLFTDTETYAVKLGSIYIQAYSYDRAALPQEKREVR